LPARPEKLERAKEFRRNLTLHERILWRHLHANRLLGVQFRPQQVIDGFIVDFYCHAAALVVEVDGAVHADQQAYDRERDAILAARGLYVLRVTNDVGTNLDGVLARIAALVRART
jgi:very-short-patch-repair endonuclease